MIDPVSSDRGSRWLIREADSRGRSHAGKDVSGKKNVASDDIHLLHQEGCIPVCSDAFLQAVIEMKLSVLDDAFEATVADLAGKFLLKAAQRQIVGGEEREAWIL